MVDRTSRGRLGEWLFTTALRCFPRDVRRRSGAHLRELFLAQRAAELTRWHWATFSARAIIDACRQGLAMRIAGRRSSRVGLTFVSRDVASALRTATKRPGAALLVIVTLMLGIAATTVTFSLADAILWHPLPFKDADRFVRVTANLSPGTRLESTVARVHEFEGLHPFRLDSGIVTVGDEPHAATIADVSAGLFDRLDVVPIWGRSFSVDDHRPGTDVVVASAALWRDLQSVRDRSRAPTVLLEGKVHTVIGALPEAFSFPVHRVLLWRPLASSETTGRVTALGILRPDVTVSHAEAAARAAASSDGLVRNLAVSPFVALRASTSTTVYALLGGVGLLLLLAIANAGQVVMSEAVRRDAEVAVRRALGASWWDVARQLVVETVLLSSIAAAVALALSTWLLQLVAVTVPYLLSFQTLRPIALDWRAFACAAVAGVGAGVGATMAALWRSRKVGAQLALRSRTVGSPSHGRLSRVLTMAQLVLTLTLLSGAATLGTSANPADHEATIQAPDHVVRVVVQLPATRLSDDGGIHALFDELREKASSLPDVVSATVAHSMPPSLGETSLAALIVDDSQSVRGHGLVWRGLVDESFFETLRIPVTVGRAFVRSDRSGSPPVAIVSASLARRLWPDSDPVGRRFRESAAEPWRTVVGVAKDIANGGLDQTWGTMAFYTPRAQSPIWWFEGLIVRTRGPAAAVVPSLREILRSRLPDAPVIEVSTGRDLMRNSMARVRFAGAVVFLFAVVALGLAVVSVYGAFWLQVRHRTPEIGVRLALGATPASVMGTVLGGGLRLLAVGLAVGIPLALVVNQVMHSWMVGLSDAHALPLTVAVIALSSAAFMATLVPAIRASRIAPVDVLR